MPSKEKEIQNNCLMGPNWLSYILYIILGLILIILIIWISSYWISAEVIHNLQGKLLIQSLGKDCVQSAKN